MAKAKKPHTHNFDSSLFREVAILREAGLPDWLIPTLISAETESAILRLRGLNRPEDRLGLTAIEAALKLRGRTAVGIMGGTKFVAKRPDGSWHPWGEFYYNLNQELAKLLIKFPNIDPKLLNGATILGGGSWGLAMHGLFHTYRKEIEAGGNGGLLMAVKSSLRDEEINPDVDQNNAVEMQPSILTRELLLILLSMHMIIVYLGSDGTFSERVLAKLLNYVSGRGLTDTDTGKMYAIEAPWRPIVVVDWRGGDQQYFFRDIDKRIENRVLSHGLSKVSDATRPPYYYIHNTSPVEAAREIASILARFLEDSGQIPHSRLFPEE